MGITTNFKNGETVNYNGKEATVVNTHSYSNYLTILVDGKQITVEKNDLFGMNKSNKHFDRLIDSCDEQIAKNKSIINDAKLNWAAAVNTIKSCREQMHGILKSSGVSTFSQITNDEQRAQYLKLKNDRGDARSVQIRASADIINAAHSVGSAALSKMNFLNQQAIYA